MTTKALLRLLAALCALSLVAAACGGDDDESADTDTAAEDGGDGGDADAGDTCAAGETDGDLNLYNWAEYIDPELKTQFEEEFGVAVNEDNYDSNEAMQPIISAGNSGYDLIVPSDYMVSILIELGDRTKNELVVLAVEILGTDEVCDLVPGRLVEHQATEQGLLSFEGVRGHLYPALFIPIQQHPVLQRSNHTFSFPCRVWAPTSDRTTRKPARAGWNVSPRTAPGIAGGPLPVPAPRYSSGTTRTVTSASTSGCR